MNDPIFALSQCKYVLIRIVNMCALESYVFNYLHIAKTEGLRVRNDGGLDLVSPAVPPSGYHFGSAVTHVGATQRVVGRS